MPRIKLQPLAEYQHKYRTEIRVTDLNYGNHLGNDALVGLLHQARVLFFRDMGLGEIDLGDGKTGVTMSDLAVNYRSEGFLFDELLIESSITEIQNSGFRVIHRVRSNGTDIALAEVGIVAFDYARRRPAKLPGEFRKALDAYLRNRTNS
ncbi:MAG: thioesterase family protein [Pseudomonadota bacterium]